MGRRWSKAPARSCSGGQEVETVGPETTALLAALHPLHHRMEELKPVRDLEAADRRAARGETWFARGRAGPRGWEPSRRSRRACGWCPRGRRWPGGWASTDELTPELALLAGGENPVALGIERLAGAPGGRGRGRSSWPARCGPSRTAMRSWHALARRGRAGLAAAYLLRPFWLAAQAPAALGAWRAARRRAG